MKKIGLMLCIFAIAFTGLLASCNSGWNGEYVSGGWKSYNYLYTVTGTLNIVEESGVTNDVTKTTTTWTIANATGELWNSSTIGNNYNHDRGNNYSWGVNPYMGIAFSGTGSVSKKVGSADPIVRYNGNINTTYCFPAEGFNGGNFSAVNSIYKLDSNYYIQYNGEYYKLESAPALNGKDFTLKFTYSDDNSSEGYVDKTTYSGTLNYKIAK